MSRAFNPTVKRNIDVNRYGEYTLREVDVEPCGLFTIHEGENGYGFAVTPIACGWKVGTFKNITTARKVARDLEAVAGVNWNGATPDEIFPNPETRNAAYAVVRAHRID